MVRVGQIWSKRIVTRVLELPSYEPASERVNKNGAFTFVLLIERLLPRAYRLLFPAMFAHTKIHSFPEIFDAFLYDSRICAHATTNADRMHIGTGDSNG